MYITKPENIQAAMGEGRAFTLSIGSTYYLKRRPQVPLTAIGYVIDEAKEAGPGQVALCGLMLRNPATDLIEPHGIDELELDAQTGPKIAIWQGALRHVGKTPEGLQMYIFQDCHPFLLDSSAEGELLVSRLACNSPCNKMQ